MDDQASTDPAKTTDQVQMDDQNTTETSKAASQAQMEYQTPAGPARNPAQTQRDDLAGALGAQVMTAFANPEDAALVKRLQDLTKKHEEMKSLWQRGQGSKYRHYDNVMIPSFKARADDIYFQLDLVVCTGSPPVEEVLQRNEKGLAEDERLTRLVESDLGGFFVAIDSKKCQAAVRTAEAVLRKAENDLQRAKAIADELAARELIQTVRAHDGPGIQLEAAQRAVHEAQEHLDVTNQKAAEAETTETAYNARAETAEATYHANILKAANKVACVKRIVKSDFPPELLKSVLEAVIRTQRLRWRPTMSDLLDGVVDSTFDLPYGLDENTRAFLREKTRIALLNKAIIELPANFTENPDTAPTLDLPRFLLGREKDIFHLILDIKLDGRDHVVQTQLNRACLGMAALALRFSNVQVLVVSLLISNNKVSLASGFQSFTLATLMLRNRKSWDTAPETVETSLVKFINVLHESGPGSVKIVRFTDQSQDGKNHFAHAGPLVRLPPFVSPLTKTDSGGFHATGAVDRSSTVGEQVLEQAYRYHRDAAYRS